MTNTDDHTETLSPDAFDLDSWLDGVTRNRATVTLYARQDLVSRVDELAVELQVLIDQAKAENKSDRSLAEAPATAERDEKRAELKQAWEQLQKSGADFQLTQMTVDEYDAAMAVVNERHPQLPYTATDEDRETVQQAREDLGGELLVLGSVTATGPHGGDLADIKLTPQQFVKMGQRFGLRQMGELVGRARELTLLSIEVDAPFSQRVSDALTADTSGK